MISVIHELLSGNSSIVTKFVEAKTFWDNFMAEHKGSTVEQLAEGLSGAQFKIERIFGRDTGKMAMPYTAFGSIYDHDNGFGARSALAKRLFDAFEKSMCSIEVKFAAKKAGAMYHLD